MHVEMIAQDVPVVRVSALLPPICRLLTLRVYETLVWIRWNAGMVSVARLRQKEG